jgi:hypothetical protein
VLLIDYRLEQNRRGFWAWNGHTRAIRQMPAAARSHETQVREEKPRSPEWIARTRGKTLYMPKRSCDDHCNN